jgi:hypothetical protein
VLRPTRGVSPRCCSTAADGRSPAASAGRVRASDGGGGWERRRSGEQALLAAAAPGRAAATCRPHNALHAWWVCVPARNRPHEPAAVALAAAALAAAAAAILLKPEGRGAGAGCAAVCAAVARDLRSRSKIWESSFRPPDLALKCCRDCYYCRAAQPELIQYTDSSHGRPYRRRQRVRHALQLAVRQSRPHVARAALCEPSAGRTAQIPLVLPHTAATPSARIARMPTLPTHSSAALAVTARLVDADVRGQADPRPGCHHQRVCEPGKSPNQARHRLDVATAAARYVPG